MPSREKKKSRGGKVRTATTHHLLWGRTKDLDIAFSGVGERFPHRDREGAESNEHKSNKA